MGYFLTTVSDQGNWLDPQAEAILIRKLAARDAEALGELYRRFGKMTFAIACRITGDQGVAEDLVQEIFLRIWSCPTLFEAQKGTLIAWITAVARHRATLARAVETLPPISGK